MLEMLPDFIHASHQSFLDVFDEPVRKFLEKEIQELGYDPVELRPAIDVSILEGKSLISLRDASVHLPPAILRARIEEHALLVVRAILSQVKKWDLLRERIKSYSSVFLVGAGISFESDIPLAAILGDLLKFVRAKDYSDLKINDRKCLKFKTDFRTICTEKLPGISHKLVTKNFPRYILEIVCLNWDDLFEKAADELKIDLHKINENNQVHEERHLWKFHGDVQNIKGANIIGKGGWIFPGEDGHVFDSFVSYLAETGLKDRLFTFVIVGYSEKESSICDNVIACFEKNQNRPTVRIGLNIARLHEQDYIVGPADFVLKKVLPEQV